MPTVIEGQSFVGQSIHARGQTIADLEIKRCSFDAAGLSLTSDIAKRTTIRDVTVVDCRTNKVQIGPVVLDQVTVDGLLTRDGMFLWAPALRHVVLRGRLGSFAFRREVDPLFGTDAQEAAVRRANGAFYADVDWALDISEAEVHALDLEGVPGHLVRRDPATQVVVTKQKALEGRWRALDLSGTWWDMMLHDYANASGVGAGPDDSIVLAAAKRHKHFRRHLDGLKQLRDAGVAEPD